MRPQSRVKSPGRDDDRSSIEQHYGVFTSPRDMAAQGMHPGPNTTTQLTDVGAAC